MKPGWYDDPTGRNDVRFWDGTQWTSRVVTHGQEFLDPLAPPPTSSTHVGAVGGNESQRKRVPAQQRTSSSKLVAVLMIVALVIMGLIRDGQIISERSADAELVAQYERSVQYADDSLKELEAQTISFGELESISALQIRIEETSNLLIELSPILNSRDELNRYSAAAVGSYNRSVDSYNTNISLYQSQMSDLNKIISRANQQYQMSRIASPELDRASLNTDRTILEMIGLAQTPKIQPSSQIEEINRGIAARNAKQNAIRKRWNDEAEKINETTGRINALHDKIYDLYGTTMGGINVEKGDFVVTGQ
jgi:hypothetical protein